MSPREPASPFLHKATSSCQLTDACENRALVLAGKLCSAVLLLVLNLLLYPSGCMGDTSEFQ